MKIEKADKNEIIETWVNDDQPSAPVHIILDGKVCLSQHQLHKPEKSSILGLATAGKIVGVKHLDSGISC